MFLVLTHTYEWTFSNSSSLCLLFHLYKANTTKKIHWKSTVRTLNLEVITNSRANDVASPRGRLLSARATRGRAGWDTGMGAHWRTRRGWWWWRSRFSWWSWGSLGSGWSWRSGLSHGSDRSNWSGRSHSSWRSWGSWLSWLWWWWGWGWWRWWCWWRRHTTGHRTSGRTATGTSWGTRVSVSFVCCGRKTRNKKDV